MSQPLFDLAGLTALVTGGSRGIGQAIAVGLAEAGADILLVQRDTSNVETKTRIEALGRKVTLYTADLSSTADVEALTPRILADGHEVRILVNNAGIQRRTPAAEFPTADWNEVLQVQLTSVFLLSRDIGRHMLSLAPHATLGRRGSIVNLASLMSFQGGVTVPAYAAAKGGVAQLTKAHANEWAGRGVNVNALAPGYIATDMTAALRTDETRGPAILERIPAARWGAPDDFKGPAVFLASRAGEYVHGHVLVVDGGWMGR